MERQINGDNSYVKITLGKVHWMFEPETRSWHFRVSLRPIPKLRDRDPKNQSCSECPETPFGFGIWEI